MTSETRHTAVVYDDPLTRQAVAAITERSGFDAAVVAGPRSQVVAQTHLLSPDVVVFDLTYGGTRGLVVVKDLRDAAPTCAVVLLAPFEGLREAAFDAGAYELVGKDDLRDLERCLRRLASECDARHASLYAGSQECSGSLVAGGRVRRKPLRS